MTRQDYIFRNASEIAERRARTARNLQSKEAERLWHAFMAAAKGVFRIEVRSVESTQTGNS